MSKRERGGKYISHDLKSSKENDRKARYAITREKRAPNLGSDGGTKPSEIYVNIELLMKTRFSVTRSMVRD